MHVKREWILVGLLVLALFVIQSWATHRYLVLPNPGANDYYSRWAGARALLLEQRDPYDLAVTKEIQQVIKIDPRQVGRGGFHYPLPVIFLFLPLVYLPYTWAQAIWQTVLVWVIFSAVLVLKQRWHWEMGGAGVLGLLLAAFFFYPATRSVLLGQFTLHVTLFVILTLWALHNGRYGWAGIFFSWTVIKPQMVLAVGVFLLLWTLYQRRYRFLGGLMGGGALLLLLSLTLFPRWVLSFWQDVQRYANVAGGRNPLLVLAEILDLSGDGLRVFLSVLFVAMMLWAWWRARAVMDWRFDFALYWTIVVSVLIPFQTGTTNQTLLLIPLFAGVIALYQWWGGWVTAVIITLLLSSTWFLFITTISGDYENQIMFLPMPLLAVCGLLVGEWRHYWLSQETVR
jgi:hypothetical protein